MKIMDADEIRVVTSILKDNIEIWIETEEGLKAATDYDYDMENGRLILK